GLALEVVARVENVEARPDVASHEARLGEAEIDLLAQRSPLEAGDEVLSAPTEVALRNAKIDDKRVDRTKAGPDRQFASGLLGDLNLQRRPVGRCAGLLGDLDLAEEAQRADVIVRPIDQDAVVGVALDQHHFAAQDRIDGPRVANDIDPLDVNPLAL